MNTSANQLAAIQPDLIGYSSDHQLQLVIEIKARVQSGALSRAQHWLQQVGNELAGGFALFVTPAMLLLRLPQNLRLVAPRAIGNVPESLQEQLKDAGVGAELDYIVDALPSLDSAVNTHYVSLQTLGSDDLQQVVSSWLSFAIITPAAELQRSSNAWLVESGLHSALYQGTIVDPQAVPLSHALIR